MCEARKPLSVPSRPRVAFRLFGQCGGKNYYSQRRRRRPFCFCGRPGSGMGKIGAGKKGIVFRKFKGGQVGRSVAFSRILLPHCPRPGATTCRRNFAWEPLGIELFRTAEDSQNGRQIRIKYGAKEFLVVVFGFLGRQRPWLGIFARRAL